MLTEEMKEKRLSLITGSDAAIICGASPYCTPHQLWLYKTRREVEPEIGDKPSVKAGVMLEGAVMEWLQFETGLPIMTGEHRELFVTHKEYPFMAGNVDGWITAFANEEWGIVEIKTTSSENGWGETGTTEIPYHYLMQVTHYMACADVDRCCVAVLIRGVDFRHYMIERDHEREDYLIEKAKRFYEYMSTDTPPPFMSGYEEIESFSKQKTGGAVEVAPDDYILECIDAIKDLESRIKEMGGQAEAYRANIKDYMKENSELMCDGKLLATWRMPSPGSMFDAKAFKAKHPDMHKEFLKEKKATRRLSLK